MNVNKPSDPSTGTSNSWIPILLLIAAFWVIVGGIFAMDTLRNATDTGRWIITAALAAAALALAIGTAMSLRTRSATPLAVALIVSAIAMPTTFAIALNAIPLIAGVATLIRQRSLRHRYPSQPAERLSQ